MHAMNIYLILLLLLSLSYAFIVGLFIRGLKRLKPGTNTVLNSFSIIIAARNEETHISRCLNSVLNQDFPLDLYEVIVVNDRSSDNTQYIIESYLRRRSNVKLVNITQCPEGVSPKKNALAHGIEKASGDIVLFTDADCIVQKTWVRTINGHFSPDVSAVAGLTTYFKPSNMHQLFFGIQAMDFFSHAVVSAAAIGAKLPINTNANNFAVRRTLFEHIKGYTKLASIVSGDDDLILQAVSKEKGNVRYVTERGGAVTTEPTRTLKGVWEQRKRWGSKTVYYNKKQVVVLASVFTYYCMILIGIMASVLRPAIFPWVIFAFIFKTLLDFRLAFPGMRLFEKQELLKYFPLAALLHIPIIVFACIFGIFGRFSWKDGYVKRKLVQSKAGL